MGKDYDHRPFSMPVVKHNTQPISGSTTGFMITRAPWQTGSNKYYVLNKLVIANGSAVNSGAPLFLNFWDQDLSNANPVARGSALGPLISVPIPFNSSGAIGSFTGTASGQLIGPYVGPVVIGHDQLPAEYFQGGITIAAIQAGAASLVSGMTVSLELQAV